MKKAMRYFVTCEHDNLICGESESTIGRASTIESAKSIIRKTRKDNGIFSNPHNFRIYDCFAEVNEATGFVPFVYKEQ